ncbi:sodium:proton antiporter [Cellulomonas sp.]|uniref:cation:proton antiporter n=1 Tax=Cellulomonas sp. TaxID=40001 RepID=UPI0028110A00|nr:sodium:proton antiporter [Cellulomonas sp.]
MDLLVAIVLGVVVIVAVTSFAPRVGVAAPLLLVLVGIGVSFLPFVPPIEVEPELVLGVILPPLLYSAAANVPAMDFRRDLRTISVFSVLLVVASALVVGVVLHALLPDIGLATAVAVGAVVSPTDAVATSIVRKAGVSPRIVTVLEGESLLNDASALVLLRSAIVATAATVSVLDVAWDFVVAVAVAVLIGWVVGRLQLEVRARLAQATSNVAISLVAPFVAYLPAEHLGASGLVAAVTAGLVTGHGGPRRLRAEDRAAQRTVWRTLELLLESAVFLVMGLEVSGLVLDVREAHGSEVLALGLGALVATLVVAVRTVFVSASVWALARRARRIPQLRAVLTRAQDRIETQAPPPGAPREEVERRRGLLRRRVRRRLADIDYLAEQAFGPREGVVLVWAGMRGAITLAAAQSLPSDTPQRSLLVLVAFVVAAGTLLVQGATLPSVVRRLGLADGPADDGSERDALSAELRQAALRRLDDDGLRRRDGTPFPPEVVERARLELASIDASDTDDDAGPVRADLQQLLLVLLDAQRQKLLGLRDVGAYSSKQLDAALVRVDAAQIGVQMRASEGG